MTAPEWSPSRRVEHAVRDTTLLVDEPCASAAKDNAGDDRGRPRQGLRLPELPGRLLVSGINFQPAHEGTPTDKPHIEKLLASVATLFAQFVAAYTGASVERRGRDVQALWSLLGELQNLLDEWLIVAFYRPAHQN